MSSQVLWVTAQSDRSWAGPIIECLRDGGVVIVPTDTVYGLAADPCNPKAIARVYALKGRDAGQPLPLLLSDTTAIDGLAAQLRPQERALIERFWPGPLTLVVDRGPGVPRQFAPGQTTVGLRVPDFPAMRGLLRAFGGPLAVTSANRSGQPETTDARAAASDLLGAVDAVVDGGRVPGGHPSSVVGWRNGALEVFREGALKRDILMPVVRGTATTRSTRSS